ncbi:MAG: UPF0262 family protein [Azospirillaceae bacterium]|nr:UPF0262 family protein [Azospirillaceae bacterium]
MTAESDRQRIIDVELVERNEVHRRPEVEHERAVAIFDLIEDNQFMPCEHPDAGPFALRLRIEDNRLIFDVRTAEGEPLTEIAVSLLSFRAIVRDYFLVCDSYYQAIRKATPSQIEAIDMGRRGLHNEGSELLRERLADKVTMDLKTARRLFTLICVLHIRG